MLYVAGGVCSVTLFSFITNHMSTSQSGKVSLFNEVCDNENVWHLIMAMLFSPASVFIFDYENDNEDSTTLFEIEIVTMYMATSKRFCKMIQQSLAYQSTKKMPFAIYMHNNVDVEITADAYQMLINCNCVQLYLLPNAFANMGPDMIYKLLSHFSTIPSTLFEDLWFESVININSIAISIFMELFLTSRGEIVTGDTQELGNVKSCLQKIQGKTIEDIFVTVLIRFFKHVWDEPSNQYMSTMLFILAGGISLDTILDCAFRSDALNVLIGLNDMRANPYANYVIHHVMRRDPHFICQYWKQVC